MGCGCKCGNCPNAFEPSHLDVGAREVASPLATMYEREESELERASHRGFARRTAPSRPQAGRRMTASPGLARRPAGPTYQARRATMGPRARHRKEVSSVKCPRDNPAGPAAALVRPAGSRGVGWPRGYLAPVGGVGLGLSPNVVILNRRFANQLGWRAYFDSIVALLGPAASGGESAFAQAVAEWQATKGLTANGILNSASWNQMQADLAAGLDAAPWIRPLPAWPLHSGRRRCRPLRFPWEPTLRLERWNRSSNRPAPGAARRPGAGLTAPLRPRCLRRRGPCWP